MKRWWFMDDGRPVWVPRWQALLGACLVGLLLWAWIALIVYLLLWL